MARYPDRKLGRLRRGVRPVPNVIRTRFEGMCAACGGWVPRGASAYYNDRNLIHYPVCPPRPPNA